MLFPLTLAALSVELIPLWAFYPLTILLLLAAVEIGFRFGRRNRQSDDQKSQVGAIMGATLGLLGFMLAFTFGMTASRFDTRKGLVLQEANAIGTCYLRADFLPEPQRAEVRGLLHKYLEQRVGFAQQTVTDVEAGFAETKQLQKQIWDATVAVVKAHGDSETIALFIDSLNEVIDLHSERVTVGLQYRIPTAIWFTLYLVAFLGMGMVGFHAGITGSRNQIATLIVVCTFSTVLLLVADLDRPGEGFLGVSQQPLETLLEDLTTDSSVGVSVDK